MSPTQAIWNNATRLHPCGTTSSRPRDGPAGIQKTLADTIQDAIQTKGATDASATWTRTVHEYQRHCVRRPMRIRTAGTGSGSQSGMGA